MERLLPLLIVLPLLGGMVFIGGQTSIAQDVQSQDPHSDSSPDQQVEDLKGQAPSPGLPSWAEPSSSPSKNQGFSVQNQSSSIQKQSTHLPGGPSNPSRVPVDGGLALLAAAGAGYAVRKLQKGEDNEGV